MSSRDREQYAALLRRIAPHCGRLSIDDMNHLLECPAAVKENRDRIFWAFARYAASLAENYKSAGPYITPYEDVSAAAFSALLKAIDTFDAQKFNVGVKLFPRYVRTGVRQAITKYIEDNERTVRIPRRSANPAIMIDIDDCRQMSSPSTDRPDSVCMAADTSECVSNMLSRVRSTSRKIIRARFGFTGGEKNLSAQARRLGISKQALHERVRNSLASMRSQAQEIGLLPLND